MYVHAFLEKVRAFFSDQWLRDHVTVFADDFHIFFSFDSEDGLIIALREVRWILDELSLHGLSINMTKTAFLLHLRGRRACKWKAKLVRRSQSTTCIRLDALTKQGEPLFIPLVSEHKYLGIVLSYRHCQMATLKVRKNLAMGTFSRLRCWWGSRFPLRERIKLWFQTVWPTLTYGLADVGCTRRGLLQLGAFAMRQLRRLARSPSHLTHESNEALCKRLGIVHPCDRLCQSVFTMWERRADRMESLPTSDVLGDLKHLCQRMSDCQTLLHPWWTLCMESWLRTGHCSADQLRRHKVACLLHLQVPEPASAQSELMPPPIQAEQVQCELCKRSFVHQMALRQHLRLAHQPASSSSLVFQVALDSLDGLPTCKHCGMQFRFWQGLIQHLDKNTCPQRDSRARVHANPPTNPELLPLIHDLQLRQTIHDHGGDAILENPETCSKLMYRCVVCNRWCPTSGALAWHMQYAHPTAYRSGREWAMTKLQQRALVVANPCRWCSQPFSKASILQKHICRVVLQVGVLAQVATNHLSLDGCLDRDGAGKKSAEATSSRRSSRSVPLLATQHDRQHKETLPIRRRPGGLVCKTSFTVSKESTQQQPKRRLRCKTTPISRQQQQQPQHHGDIVRSHGQDSVTSRGRNKSCPARHKLCNPHSNERSHLAVPVRDFTSVEEREGAGAHTHTTSIALGAVLLHGGLTAVQASRGAQHGQRHLQGDGQEQAAHRGLHLLQDDLESRGGGAHTHRSWPISSRSTWSSRRSDPQTCRTLSCQSLPWNATSGIGIPRQEHHILVGAVASTSVGHRHLQHHGHAERFNLLRCSSVTNAQINSSKKLFGERSAATTQSHDSPLNMYRTWTCRGRDDVPLACFPNPSNYCYCNATVVALIACHHLCHRHPLCRADQWGCIADIVAAAHTDWRGLWHVPSFLLALQNWEEPAAQHDVLEFAQHLSQTIPLLVTSVPHVRNLDGSGSIETVLVFHLVSEVNTLESCVHHWSTHEIGRLQALVHAPPLLLIPVARFEYYDRRPLRLTGSLQIESSEIELPLFSDHQGLHTTSVTYRLVACILHTGESPIHGHYRTMALSDGGFIIADDDRPCVYTAYPAPQELQNIALLYLIRSDCIA